MALFKSAFEDTIDLDFLSMPPKASEVLRKENEPMTYEEQELLRAQKSRLESDLYYAWRNNQRLVDANAKLSTNLAATVATNAALQTDWQKGQREKAEMERKLTEMEKAQAVNLDITKELVRQNRILETSVSYLTHQNAMLQELEVVRENEELRARVAHLEARINVQNGWPADAPAASDDLMLDCLDA